jgi:hypothetical protein
MGAGDFCMIMDINSMHLRPKSYNYRRKEQVLFPGVPIWYLSTVRHIKQAHRAARSGFLCSAWSAIYKQLKAEPTAFNAVENNWVDTEFPAILKGSEKKVLFMFNVLYFYKIKCPFRRVHKIA